MNIGSLETQLNVLENFDPILPEEYKNSEYLMLGNLMPSVKKSFKSNEKDLNNSIRYNEFLDGSFLEELTEAIKEVDV